MVGRLANVGDEVDVVCVEAGTDEGDDAFQRQTHLTKMGFLNSIRGENFLCDWMSCQRLNA